MSVETVEVTAHERSATRSKALATRLLFGQKTIVYPIVAILIVVAKYGAGTFASLQYTMALAQFWQHPNSSPLLSLPGADYFLYSPVSAELAGMLGFTNESSFLGLHAILVLLTLALPFCFTVVRRSPNLRATMFLLVVGGSSAAYLLEWLGSYDPVSVAAAATTIGLATSPVLTGIGWMFLAFNNGAEAIFAFPIFLVVLAVGSDRRRQLRRFVWSASGFAIGLLAIHLLVNYWGGATSRIGGFERTGYSQILNSAINFFPVIIVSTLAIGWFILLSSELRRQRLVQVFLGLALATFSIAVPLLVLDQTRVPSTILWASLLWVVRSAIMTVDEERLRRSLLMLSPIAILTPVLVIWSSNIVYGGWQSLWNVVDVISRWA